LADDIIKKFNFKRIPQYKIDKMVKLMQMDKKSSKGNITFILPVDYFEVKAFEFTPDEIL
jgi:3-dehydroquinate synthetase